MCNLFSLSLSSAYPFEMSAWGLSNWNSWNGSEKFWIEKETQTEILTSTIEQRKESIRKHKLRYRGRVRLIYSDVPPRNWSIKSLFQNSFFERLRKSNNESNEMLRKVWFSYWIQYIQKSFKCVLVRMERNRMHNTVDLLQSCWVVMVMSPHNFPSATTPFAWLQRNPISSGKASDDQ